MITHSGGCLCGAIRFEVRNEPLRRGYCHCAFCRRQTGAPVAAFADFRHVDFRWISGKPTIYRSSPAVRRSFCRKCGTPLTYQTDRRPDEIDVAIGVFDEPDLLPPTEHGYWSQKIAWFDTADDLPRLDGVTILPKETPRD